MIVKNEEKNLPGILADIRGVVDEICVVDTGSTDNTIAVAESFGARIGHFPWVGDFAVARNHSIEIADADYLLWVDADDRIDLKDQQALASLKPLLRHQKDRAYLLKIINSAKDAPEAVNYQARIIPNNKGVRFEGKVHEQIIPALKRCAFKIESIDISIRHTGYHDRDTLPEKARRNMEILTEELKSGKDTATQYYFLAMAAIGMRDYEQCLKYLDKARQKHADEDWLHFSYTVTTDCLLKLGRIEEARQEIVGGIAIFPDSPLLHYYHGNVCMQAKRFSEAADALAKAATLPLLIDAYPTPPDLNTISLILYGNALEKTGKLDDAIAVYTRALKTGTRQKELSFALGLALFRQGRVEEALPRLEKARELAPEFDPVLWLALAKVHLFLGHHAQSHALYRESFTKMPDDRDTATGLIQTSVAMDDVENLLAALEALMNSLGMDTDRELATPADIACLCAEVGRKLHEDATTPYAARLAEAALAIDPGLADAHLLLFDTLIAQGNRADAIPHLEQATHAGAPLALVEKRLALLESS